MVKYNLGKKYQILMKKCYQKFQKLKQVYKHITNTIEIVLHLMKNEPENDTNFELRLNKKVLAIPLKRNNLY